jgi:hypothetical protein
MPHPKTTYRSGRKVIVDDKIDALEVNAASHELGTDEHPDAAGTEGAHRVLSLLLRPARTSINLTVIQCWGSGSACFWASRIRIH